MAKPSTPITETQSTRRVKYGLNVFIAVIAAIAIVVLINWISYRSFRSGATRWDFTSTRQYSLSPLTQKVIESLDGEVQLVTLMDAGEDAFEDTQRARDLIDEYDRESDNIKAIHINPAIETGKLDEFRRAIHDRFAPQLATLSISIKDTRAQVGQAIKQLDDVYIERLGKILIHPDLKADRNTLLLRDLERFFKSTRKQLAEVLEKEKNYSDAALPRYGTTLINLLTALDALDRQVYPSLLKNVIEPLKTSATLPQSVLNDVLLLGDAMKASQEQRIKFVHEQKKFPGVPAYSVIVSRLALPNPVVIMAKQQIVVLPINELFRTSKESQANAEETMLQNKHFLGEERITSILARMIYTKLANPPLVVLCQTGGSLGAHAKRDYAQLIERLGNMDLMVAVWDPKPLANDPSKRPRPAPPVAEGQRAVWIVLPSDPVTPGDKIAETFQKMVFTHVRDRMDQGDGALLIHRPETETDQSDLILKEWGFAIDFNHILVKHVVDNFGKNRPSAEFVMREWPNEHLISKAIGEQGMSAAFSWCSPVRVEKEQTGVTYSPLAVLASEKIWANFQTTQMRGQRAEIKPDLPQNIQGDSFAIAYAAQREPTDKMARGRLIVVGDQFWAIDRFGSYPVKDPVTRRLTRVTPFPGNHELFVNSVLWLAGMDEMIAASSRSQDVARIAAISTGGMRALKVTLLLGMPIGVFIIGAGVWWSRRG